MFFEPPDLITCFFWLQVSWSRSHRLCDVDVQPKTLLHVFSLVPSVKPNQQGGNSVPPGLHTLKGGGDQVTYSTTPSKKPYKFKN